MTNWNSRSAASQIKPSTATDRTEKEDAQLNKQKTAAGGKEGKTEY